MSCSWWDFADRSGVCLGQHPSGHRQGALSPAPAPGGSVCYCMGPYLCNFSSNPSLQPRAHPPRQAPRPQPPGWTSFASLAGRSHSSPLCDRWSVLFRARRSCFFSGRIMFTGSQGSAALLPPPSLTHPPLPTLLPAHWGLSVVSGGLLGYFQSLNLLSPSLLSSYCIFFFLQGLGEGLWNEADIFLVNFFFSK